MSTNVKVVNLEGEFTLPHADRLGKLVRDAIDQKSMVLLSLSQTTDIDLAGIQVIYACRRYANKKNRSLHLTGAIPEIVARRLYQGGFTHDIHRDGRDLDQRLVEFEEVGNA